MASPYRAPDTAPVAWTITIDDEGNATSNPTVKAGDTVQWQASAEPVFVDPPNIFNPQPNGQIDLDANATSGTFHVSGQPGSYVYTSGLQEEERGPGDGNDTITIST
jgi:hypothetical protein